MTSRDTRSAMIRRTLQLLLLAAALPAIGCANSGKPLVVSAPLHSPWSENRLLAVAPLYNETGVSTLDALHYSDLLVAELQQVRGVDVTPMQRVLGAMEEQDIAWISSVDEARAIARTLGADGIVVGTLTSYDPYYPPRLGLALELIPVRAGGPGVSLQDTRALQSAASDMESGITSWESGWPTASEIVDSSDNGVRIHLERFAAARTDPESALGTTRYLYQNDLFMRYVSYRLISELLRQERLRLVRQAGSSRSGNAG